MHSCVLMLSFLWCVSVCMCLWDLCFMLLSSLAVCLCMRVCVYVCVCVCVLCRDASSALRCMAGEDWANENAAEGRLIRQRTVRWRTDPSPPIVSAWTLRRGNCVCVCVLVCIAAMCLYTCVCVCFLWVWFVPDGAACRICGCYKLGNS